MSRFVSRRQVLVGALGGLVGVAGCPGTPARGQDRESIADFSELIARCEPAVHAVRDQNGTLGSAFVIRHRRLAVTAAHVVSASRGELAMTRGTERRVATVIAQDADVDVAVLAIDGLTDHDGLELREPTVLPRVGEWVIVLGNPFGAGTTATIGIVSALPGTVIATTTLASRLQINASVNPGNSGGPVLDSRGRVLGLASAMLPGGSGLGFAVTAAALAAALDAAGSVSKPHRG